jgi:hypothetical protein
MTVVLRSIDVFASESESHGVLARVTKALVPQRCVSLRWANTFVSKKGSEITGKGVKMREIVLHYEDEASM